ncbi:hypothetical protein [Rhizobium sp. 18055]|uniref:hypothetical protein n=1 Tax=Rhizobium sp. 18055 TaxID=2681403 RepID=UPI00135C6830|nr:hypothetical protein [Rhizobium sp. 18055]
MQVVATPPVCFIPSAAADDRGAISGGVEVAVARHIRVMAPVVVLLRLQIEANAFLGIEPRARGLQDGMEQETFMAR